MGSQLYCLVKSFSIHNKKTRSSFLFYRREIDFQIIIKINKYAFTKSITVHIFEPQWNIACTPGKWPREIESYKEETSEWPSWAYHKGKIQISSTRQRSTDTVTRTEPKFRHKPHAILYWLGWKSGKEDLQVVFQNRPSLICQCRRHIFLRKI